MGNGHCNPLANRRFVQSRFLIEIRHHPISPRDHLPGCLQHKCFVILQGNRINAREQGKPRDDENDKPPSTIAKRNPLDRGGMMVGHFR